MTDNATTVSLLDEVLATEKRSLVLRLADVNPFVTWAGVRAADTLRPIIREQAEHADWLSEAILQRGGAPSWAPPDARTGSIHYVDLVYLLPRIVRDEQHLLQVCESAATRAS